MSLAYRRVSKPGIQWIPPFSGWVTLHQIAQCWDKYAEDEPFPEATSRFNVACLALFPRGRMTAGLVGQQALSRSFWSTQKSDGIACIFGVDKVYIPQGCELASVSWMQPPTWALENLGPYPEQLFRLQYGLKL